ncbi:polyprotein-like, partial [Trifolium medium]|nr:polyprotein-like [Trifolium medium]
MYSSLSSQYDQQFPALERKIDPITHRASKPFVQPSEVLPDGKLKPLSQAEEVLNWQSKNMIAQNDSLQSLNEKIVKTTERIEETEENLKILSKNMQKYYRDLKAQISQLNQDLRTMPREQLFGTTFNQKEREMKNLKKQVKELDDIIKAFKESKEPQQKPIESIFFNPPSFPTYFTRPERPPPFQLTSPFLASSPLEFMPSAYRTKSTRDTVSNSKNKGKAVSLNGSSTDSQDNPEAPPSKYQKEEQESQPPDQGYPALAITSHRVSDT